MNNASDSLCNCYGYEIDSRFIAKVCKLDVYGKVDAVMTRRDSTKF